MNWLAHIFISKNSIDYQLGNLLADPLKGKIWQGAGMQVTKGFNMHRQIDAFTDSSEFVKMSKSRLGPKGYLKAVTIDIVYDHLLLKNWDQFSKVSLKDFIKSFYDNAGQAVESYPDKARHFVSKIIESDCLTSYDTYDGLETAFSRIDKRLSRRLLSRESTIDYLPRLKGEITGIENDFLIFFPQLINYFISQEGMLPEEHWIRQ